MAARHHRWAQGGGLIQGGILLAAACMVTAALAASDVSSAEVATADSARTAMSKSETAATARHIATLHAKLRITPAQEPLWRPLAAAMWNSVVALDRVYAERGRQYDHMSAVDDLRSYSQVQQTNADNVKSLIGPFEQLYASFSPAQKRRADAALRQFTDSAVKASR